MSDDAGREADVGGAVRPVVRIILSIGNVGMLLSASPLALVVEHWGWRAGFWISAGFGAVVAIAVFSAGPETTGGAGRPVFAAVANGRGAAHRSVASAARVDRTVAGVARGVAGAAGIVGRSMADGDQGAEPHRGGQMLGLFTLALIAGPVLMGVLDRAIGHRREVLAATHSFAALLLALMAAGAPHYPLPGLFGVRPYRPGSTPRCSS